MSMVLLWLLQFKACHFYIWRIQMIFWSYRIGDPSVLTSQKSAQLLIQSTNVCSMKFVRKSFLRGELHVNLDHILELQDRRRSFNLDITRKHCLGFSFVFSAPLPAWRACTQVFFLVSLAYWSRAQISNHHRACTKALLLYKKHKGFL